MQCIFCLNERPESDEHIFPLAVGGWLITTRVCKCCNGKLGTGADGSLSNSKFVKVRRSELGLAGNSGAVPDAVIEMMKYGELQDYPGVRVRASIDPVTGSPDFRIVQSEIIRPDGTRALVIDPRDINGVVKRIQRERKKAKQPPLSEEEIATFVKQAQANTQKMEQPWLNYKLEIPIDECLPGLAKIAYELAFRWFGEAYLADETGANLRTAVMANDLTAAPVVVIPEVHNSLRFWLDEKNSHIAMTSISGEKLFIIVRLFDFISGAILVSEQASLYLSSDSGDERLRFLALDPITRELRDTPFWMEATRLMNRQTSDAGGQVDTANVPVGTVGYPHLGGSQPIGRHFGGNLPSPPEH